VRGGEREGEDRTGGRAEEEKGGEIKEDVCCLPLKSTHAATAPSAAHLSCGGGRLGTELTASSGSY
jgi:hypothetical protein